MLNEGSRYRLIRVELIQHKKSDLMLAMSDDLPGLMVPVRSVEEVSSKLPRAIKELLEAQGNRVGEVTSVEEVTNIPESFTSSKFSARAEVYCD